MTDFDVPTRTAARFPTDFDIPDHTNAGFPPWPTRFTTRFDADPQRSLRTLDHLCRLSWTMVRLLAASTLDIAPFEAKLALGEAVFALTETAATIEERIHELGGRVTRAPWPADLARLTAALCFAPDDRLPLLARDWWRPLLRAFDEARFDPLLDGPSERVRRRGLTDLEHASAWFELAYGQQVREAATVVEPAEPAEPAGPLRRPVTGARDHRFQQFAHTRDYRKAGDWASSGSAYLDDLVELARINRDEIDALETFCLALFDLVDEAPQTVLRHLARLAWDEARHAACGHALLASLGHDPYAFECSMIGIRVRGAMSGWDAWTQITLFGELGIIGPMRRLEKAARARGDAVAASAFGFICRDETLHLKDSRTLLDEHHPAGGLAAAGEAARRRAGALLEEFGLLDEEQYRALSPQEIFALLGE